MLFNGWMTDTRGIQAKRRGHNAIVTGLAMLVLGIAVHLIFATGGEDSSESFLYGFSILVAFAGLITLIVGFGIRRERS